MKSTYFNILQINYYWWREKLISSFKFVENLAKSNGHRNKPANFIINKYRAQKYPRIPN